MTNGLRALVLALAAFTAAPAAQAQEIIAEYFTLLGPRDFYNSNGVRLTDTCAIIQQDRANFHRFGIRDDLDQGDPVFGDRAMRAMIPQICRFLPGQSDLARFIGQGNTAYIYVQIMGSGGRVTEMLVFQGAG